MSSYRGAAGTDALSQVSGAPQDVVTLPQVTRPLYKNHFKRLLDVTLVLLAAVVAAPVIALFALLVFLGDGHAPFYTQNRVGKGRRVFRMWKLRSMVANADEVLEAHLADNPRARAEWDRHQKLRHDPRVTPIGRIIRKVSLDELPQLWNVLVGDMSLVGPRPIMTNQVALYPCTAYYRLRPGLTGFWQVSSRNKSTFAERARFDRLYEDRVSLAADMAVMARTVGVVVRATGV